MNSNTVSRNSVVLERIEQLRCELGTLIGKTDQLAQNVQQFQLTYTAEHIKVVEQTTAAHRRIDDHDKRLDELTRAISEEQKSAADIASQVRQMKAILGWIGGAVGVMVMALLWEIITHQTVLTMP